MSDAAEPNVEQASFAFVGSATALAPLHAARVLALVGFCLTLPFGLGEAALLEVETFAGAVGLGGAWRLSASAVESLPLASTGLVALCCLILWGMFKGRLEHYRVQHTRVDGAPLELREGCNPLPSWLAFVAIVCSLGLATPWVSAWRKRREYGACHTPHGPLGFRGSGIQIAGYGLLSLLAIPLVFCTLGFAGIPLRYLWLRWEQSNLEVPGADGGRRVTRFTGSLAGYARLAAVRWLLTLITLGIYRPWGLVALWSWRARHTVIQDA